MADFTSSTRIAIVYKNELIRVIAYEHLSKLGKSFVSVNQIGANNTRKNKIQVPKQFTGFIPVSAMNRRATKEDAIFTLNALYNNVKFQTMDDIRRFDRSIASFFHLPLPRFKTTNYDIVPRYYKHFYTSLIVDYRKIAEKYKSTFSVYGAKPTRPIHSDMYYPTLYIDGWKFVQELTLINPRSDIVNILYRLNKLRKLTLVNYFVNADVIVPDMVKSFTAINCNILEIKFPNKDRLKECKLVGCRNLKHVVLPRTITSLSLSSVSIVPDISHLPMLKVVEYKDIQSPDAFIFPASIQRIKIVGCLSSGIKLDGLHNLESVVLKRVTVNPEFCLLASFKRRLDGDWIFIPEEFADTYTSSNANTTDIEQPNTDIYGERDTNFGNRYTVTDTEAPTASNESVTAAIPIRAEQKRATNFSKSVGQPQTEIRITNSMDPEISESAKTRKREMANLIFRSAKIGAPFESEWADDIAIINIPKYVTAVTVSECFGFMVDISDAFMLTELTAHDSIFMPKVKLEMVHNLETTLSAAENEKAMNKFPSLEHLVVRVPKIKPIIALAVPSRMVTRTEFVVLDSGRKKIRKSVIYVGTVIMRPVKVYSTEPARYVDSSVIDNAMV